GPYPRCARPRADHAERRMTGSSPLHVLLVEDSRTQAARAQLVLEASGYHVTVARDGNEAWELIVGEAFDIIVCDINLPGIDGYEVCRRVRADSTRCATPFVIQTSHEEFSALVRGIEVGADDFILKTWTPTELIDRIGVVVNSRVRPGPASPAGTTERMTALLLSRTKELEGAYQLSDRQRVELGILNHSLEVSVQELKSANLQLAIATKHKSDFLAKMSHELRSPLTAILGFTELMLDPTRKFEPAKQQGFLVHIRTAGAHLLTLVNDLLDLARVEAGKMEMKREKVCLKPVLQESAAIISGIAQ